MKKRLLKHATYIGAIKLTEGGQQISQGNWSLGVYYSLKIFNAPVSRMKDLKRLKLISKILKNNNWNIVT